MVDLVKEGGNSSLFPSDPSTLDRGWTPWGRWTGWMTPEVALSLPGIARGVSVIVGQAMQMPLDDYKGVTPLIRPRLLDQPDPDESRAWFVEVQWRDYILEGNAVHLVTTRDAEGWPATVAAIPAAWVHITRSPLGVIDYWVGGVKLNRADVVHVKRGRCTWAPWRGVGVVEQHLDALGNVRDLHRYEKENLSEASVPSVAVIAPNPRLGQEEADDAKEAWIQKFGGPTREPAILPNGTQVIPLSWSPSDAQMIEARKLSLTDAANMLNLDGYWVGAAAGSMTYRSPGPMYLNLIRQTIGPIAQVFEDVWSSYWLPRGRRVRYDRQAVLVDDMGTMVTTAGAAFTLGLWTREEARAYLGVDPEMPEGTVASSTSPVATVDQPAGTTADGPNEPALSPDEEEE